MSPTNAPILQAKEIRRSFFVGGSEIEVLRGVDLKIREGQSLAILGQSGAGKSTLLNILGGLDKPTNGTVSFQGQDLTDYSGENLALFRNKNLGFVFQFHHLLPEFSALENVMMPGVIREIPRHEMMERSAELLEDVGLGGRMTHMVGKLSGGERQRVAVARALVLSPDLVLADEPTGNLDSETGAQIADLLLDLNLRMGGALVVATHNRGFADRLESSFTLADGRIVEDIRN